MILCALLAGWCVWAQTAAGAYAASDPVPLLLDSAQVTADVARLAQGGRAVKGVAADGVAKAVISVSAASPGQEFTFQVLNDENQPSTSPGDDCALGSVADRTLEQSSVAVDSVSTPQGPLAFVIYQAPLDFARPGERADASPPEWQRRAAAVPFARAPSSRVPHAGVSFSAWRRGGLLGLGSGSRVFGSLEVPRPGSRGELERQLFAAAFGVR